MTAWPVRTALKTVIADAVKHGGYTPKQIARSLRQYADSIDEAADEYDDPYEAYREGVRAMDDVEHL